MSKWTVIIVVCGLLVFSIVVLWVAWSIALANAPEKTATGASIPIPTCADESAFLHRILLFEAVRAGVLEVECDPQTGAILFVSVPSSLVTFLWDEGEAVRQEYRLVDTGGLRPRWGFSWCVTTVFGESQTESESSGR